MTESPPRIDLVHNDLKLSAQLVPWDSDIFDFSVAEIKHLEFTRPERAQRLYSQFEHWRDSRNVQLVSCRLPHELLNESIFLEKNGFRFIETILHPVLSDLDSLILPEDTLIINEAKIKDIPRIKNIAANAFLYERFHVDPRLNSTQRGGVRYSNWVENSFKDKKQKLIKIVDRENIIGFFIVEIIQDRDVYWHLTAIAPEFQGQGYGKRAWLAILRHHMEDGIVSVSTSISARNIPVLNLYSQLSFRFNPPDMTFHWVSSR